MKTFLSILFSILIASPHAAYAQDANEQKDPFEHPFANPVDAPGLPRVFIIGDSISNGYTPRVRRQLDGVANVHRPTLNCRWSAFGDEHIEEWLGNSKWDVIHFNFGLWDWYGWSQEQKATPESYAKSLESIVLKMRAKTDATLIFAITTPPCVGPEKKVKIVFSEQRAKEFNKAARTVMEKHNVRINNLYDVVRKDRERYQRGPDDVHYTEEGRDILAARVASRIKASLSKKDTPMPAADTAPPALSAGKAKGPNIVFFLIDDLGRQDLGCYGSTFHETPRIDALAKEGVLFTDAYSASPVCSPTRASILTGKYPSRVGITRATPQVSLPLKEITIAEALKEAGYRTAHMGKWHLQAHGETGRTHYPEAQGFDVNVAGHTKGQPASFFYPYKAKAEKYAKNNVPDLEGGKEGEFLTDRLTDEAINFIDESGDQPFLLNLWYYAVHTPVMGKPEKVEKYKKKAEKLGYDPKEELAIEEKGRWHHSRQDNTEYAAMVESMDENVGRLLDYLKESGKDKNTVVIFMSDNGGLSTGSGKKSPTSCLPLRAGKAWVYEGGVRQPMIIKWPGVTTAGTVCKEPVISTDFYPTILEMAGQSPKPEQHLDGLSLVPLLQVPSSKLDRDSLFFHHPHDHHINGMGSSGAVRVGDFKLVETYGTGEVELYHLKDDIGEQNDLSKSMPEKTKELKQRLHRWKEEASVLSNKTN